jgi:hypothetical protein
MIYRWVTTDYILDELLTLLLVRGERERALRVGAALPGGSLAELHWLTREDIHRAWDVFRQFSDKGWSFSDCTSCAVMEHLASRQPSRSTTISGSSASVQSCRWTPELRTQPPAMGYRGAG